MEIKITRDRHLKSFPCPTKSPIHEEQESSISWLLTIVLLPVILFDLEHNCLELLNAGGTAHPLSFPKEFTQAKYATLSPLPSWLYSHSSSCADPV